MSGHTLLREAAFRYVRTYERYERQQARGDLDSATDSFAKIQTMERCLSIVEHSREWRSADEAEP